MTSIASPRASGRQSPTSSRSSLSLDRTAPPSTTSLRRNRAALRDYYKLRSAPLPHEDPPSSSDPANPPSPPSELDAPSFSAPAYVASLLARESLEGILKVEASLISDIRGADGERKALVYDNYSKLIKATETIRGMREGMEPVGPVEEAVGPGLERIVRLAGEIVAKGKEGGGDGVDRALGEKSEEHGNGKVERQKQTVRWVLETPRRLEGMVTEGRREEAEAEWTEVNRILEKWEGVRGVEDVKERAQEALKG